MFAFSFLQIVRFQDKDSHQIFLEPEGRNVPEIYVQVILELPSSWFFIVGQSCKICLKKDISCGCELGSYLLLLTIR